MMTIEEAINLLKIHNLWRRGADIPMVKSTSDLGLAIGIIINELEVINKKQNKMAKFRFENGSEIEVKESVQVNKEGDIIIDGIIYPIHKQEDKGLLLYRALLLPNNTLLPSMHRHDYRTSEVDGFKYMIDGGTDYLRCSNDGRAEVVEVYISDDIDVVRQVAGRAGYGKDGKESFRACMVKEMSNEWLEASVEYAPTYAPIYRGELDFRDYHGKYINDNVFSYPSWEEAWLTINEKVIINWFKDKKTCTEQQ